MSINALENMANINVKEKVADFPNKQPYFFKEAIQDFFSCSLTKKEAQSHV